jgi:hypothetical protein
MEHNFQRRSSFSASPSYGLFCLVDEANQSAIGAEIVLHIRSTQRMIQTFQMIAKMAYITKKHA